MCLLHHVFGEVNGKKGAWGHAIGGMGAITQAMAKAAAARGVDIRVASPVREVWSKAAARSAWLREGRSASGAQRRIQLQSEAAVRGADRSRRTAAGFSRAHQPWRCGIRDFSHECRAGGAARLQGVAGPHCRDHHTAGIIMAPSLAYMDQAYLDAKAGGWSKQPIVEMLIPSTLDDSLAPPGQHVASLFCQHVAPVLPNDASWDAHREEVADVMIDSVNSHAPNFKAAVLGRQIMSPLDLERTFGLMGGDIFHGALSLDQLFSARPMLGHGDYRGP